MIGYIRGGPAMDACTPLTNQLSAKEGAPMPRRKSHIIKMKLKTV